MELIRPSS
ncbi:hypothetical protein FG05_35147 [Fusarium graminearum]|nr:hypothetical protein FG05_35147 [Fusarium graminearum]